MYTIYLFFLDVKATVETQEKTLTEAMMHVIKYQSWTKDDLLIFRDKIHELLRWIETYINERYDA